MDWYDRAACQTVEPELFFPIGTSGLAHDDVAAAKMICSQCAVQERCREYALETRQVFGVWGGLDEEQRRVLWSQPAATLA